ncbi:hypothetical protein AVEN_134809-1 [Araneus ventricosus]|uniref:Uncharacterized protein n=1 Tax=Araneus ventricosus TaxID=182803 RepID=A0A4Y2GAN2_ARAVE|nr:hypothetical protein AVEN_134809-1 [Araneus ventricosus]
MLEKYQESPNYLLARAISKIEDNKCLALVMNLKDEPLHLNKNMLLAKVEPVLYTSAEEFVYNATENKDKKSFNWEQNHDLSHLDAVEKAKLLEKYDSIFAQNIEELGERDLVQHQIHLTDSIPTRQRPYRVPYALNPLTPSGPQNLTTFVFGGFVDIWIREMDSSAFSPFLLTVGGQKRTGT